MIDRRRTQAEVDEFAKLLRTRRPRMGDRGQRYEILAKGGAGEEFTIGWSNNPDAFKAAVELHPAWTDRRIIDRQPQQEVPKP